MKCPKCDTELIVGEEEAIGLTIAGCPECGTCYECEIKGAD